MVKPRLAVLLRMGTRSSQAFVSLVLAAVLVARASAQGIPSDERNPAWDQSSIALWTPRIISQLHSLTAFAGRACPPGNSPEEYQAKKERSGALHVLRDVVTTIRPTVIAKNNLAFYHRHVLHAEGRYELTDWPAADTLVTIGSRSYPAIFERMEDHCDELDVRLLAQIFASIDGRELAIQRLKIYQREHPKNAMMPDDEFPQHFNIRKVLALLEDPDFDKGKYSPTKYYTQVLKKG